MINSLYLLSPKNIIMLEKHWKAVMDKSVYRQFIDAEIESSTNSAMSPVIENSKYILVHIKENHITFLAICEKEINPLLVVEFLTRISQVIVYYFKYVTESVIEDNLINIYEILDEMLDSGFPLVTEPNVLEELVRPPNILRNLSDQVTRQSTAVSSFLPAGQLSIVPWRRVGVKYPTNEVYFDFYEVIDAILEPNGNAILTEVVGTIKTNTRLSGLPDLVLHFNNPRLIDDVALHPCVRFSKWSSDKVLSFVPPDGNFDLCTYFISANSNIKLPITIKSLSKIDENRAFLDLTVVGNKLNSKKSVDNLVLTVQLPPVAANVVCRTCSHGKTKFDMTTNCLVWSIGRLDVFQVASIKGPISLVTSGPVVDQSYGIDISATFKIEQCVMSGVSVSKVDLFGEKYTPFKGVKYNTISGKYHMRS